MKSMVATLCLAGGLAAQSLETVTVTAAPVSRTVKLPAELLPFQKVAVTARVSGLVEKIDVDRGSRVQAGQVLAVLSAPEMAAQIAEAEARVESIEAQRAESDARRVAAESTLERLQAAAKTAGAVADNDIVQARKQVESAQAVGHALAKSADAARASVSTLKELQSYLMLTAPFEGVVSQRLVHPGALASPQSGPLVEIEQVSKLRLVVAVPEADLGGVARSAKVTFTVPAYPGRTFAGQVARLSPSLDARSRTLAVEADVDNTGGALSPGMYAEVAWPVRRAQASLWVPATAVAVTTERTFVVRVVNGKAEWVNVTRGVRNGDLVEVAGALSAGDTVLKRGTDEIRDGQALPRGAGR